MGLHDFFCGDMIASIMAYLAQSLLVIHRIPRLRKSQNQRESTLNLGHETKAKNRANINFRFSTAFNEFRAR